MKHKQCTKSENQPNLEEFANENNALERVLDSLSDSQKKAAIEALHKALEKGRLTKEQFLNLKDVFKKNAKIIYSDDFETAITEGVITSQWYFDRNIPIPMPAMESLISLQGRNACKNGYITLEQFEQLAYATPEYSNPFLTTDRDPLLTAEGLSLLNEKAITFETYLTIPVSQREQAILDLHSNKQQHYQQPNMTRTAMQKEIDKLVAEYMVIRNQIQDKLITEQAEQSLLTHFQTLERLMSYCEFFEEFFSIGFEEKKLNPKNCEKSLITRPSWVSRSPLALLIMDYTIYYDSLCEQMRHKAIPILIEEIQNNYSSKNTNKTFLYLERGHWRSYTYYTLNIDIQGYTRWPRTMDEEVFCYSGLIDREIDNLFEKFKASKKNCSLLFVISDNTFGESVFFVKKANSTEIFGLLTSSKYIHSSIQNKLKDMHITYQHYDQIPLLHDGECLKHAGLNIMTINYLAHQQKSTFEVLWQLKEKQIDLRDYRLKAGDFPGFFLNPKETQPKDTEIASLMLQAAPVFVHHGGWRAFKKKYNINLNVPIKKDPTVTVKLEKFLPLNDPQPNPRLIPPVEINLPEKPRSLSQTLFKNKSEETTLPSEPKKLEPVIDYNQIISNQINSNQRHETVSSPQQPRHENIKKAIGTIFGAIIGLSIGAILSFNVVGIILLAIIGGLISLGITNFGLNKRESPTQTHFSRNM